MSTTGSMTARDYQHHRFQKRGGGIQVEDDDEMEAPGSPVRSHPPVVTPNSNGSNIPSPLRSPDMSMSRRVVGSLSGMPPASPLSIDSSPAGHYSSIRSLKTPIAGQYSSNRSLNVTTEMEALQAIGSDEDQASDSGHYSATSNSSHTDSIGNGMKEMIQPFVREQQDSPSKTPKALGASTSRLEIKPKEQLRYSLQQGKAGMTEAMRRRASDSLVDETRLKTAHSLALQGTSATEDKRSRDARMLSSSGKTLSSRSSKSRSDPDCYKIFLLLLQPKSKIFELIQLTYDPNDATVGDVLEMIPDNATEEALGKQEYVGLCRPKQDEVIMNTELMASEPTRPLPEGVTIISAKITVGEILVAIPYGFTGKDVTALSSQILENPKIVKLLKRSDPLAPKRRRSKRRSSKRRSSSRKNVAILEKHDEKEEFVVEKSERKIEDAMMHAAKEAAAANAAITTADYDLEDESETRLRRLGSIGSYSERSLGGYSTGASLDESFTSWSKSFEESFSAQSSLTGGVSKRATRRRERQARRLLILKRAGEMAIVLMFALYYIDPQGYASPGVAEVVAESPMGLVGIFQTMFLLLTLYKLQRYVRSKSKDADPVLTMEQQKRCPFLRASAQAMEDLRARYTSRLAKLKKKQRGGVHRVSGGSIEGDSRLSQRLRSFSLKARDNADDENASMLNY